MNLKQVVQAEIPLGLGSDSVASNNSMDLFEEMRFSLFNPSWFGCRGGRLDAGGSRREFAAEQALHLATLGGARALGFVALDRVAGSGKKSRPDCGGSGPESIPCRCSLR